MAALKQIPNILTVLRMILIIPLVIFLLTQNYTAAFMIFFLAGLTDGIDGLLARRFKWETRFGAIADPLADKALMVSCFTILTFNNHFEWWFFIVVVSRDLIIVLGAIIFHCYIAQYEVKPSLISKLNTFLQILLLLLLLIHLGLYALPEQWLKALVWLVCFTSLTSLLHYSWLWGGKVINHHKSQKTDKGISK